MVPRLDTSSWESYISVCLFFLLLRITFDRGLMIYWPEVYCIVISVNILSSCYIILYHYHVSSLSLTSVGRPIYSSTSSTHILIHVVAAICSIILLMCFFTFQLQTRINYSRAGFMNGALYFRIKSSSV